MNEYNKLNLICMFLLILVCAGWYFAEAENEVLREELATQNYMQQIHHGEDKNHD